MAFIDPSTRRELVCNGCGALVPHWQVTHYPGGVHWAPNGHDGPCGAPCLQGGVDGKIYRAGMYCVGNDGCAACSLLVCDDECKASHQYSEMPF